jgi:RNA polymerase sigma-70 factor (ECF subfamily)
MLRVQNGDVAAFDELFHRHRPRVVRLVTRMLGNATQSEDIAQEVFLRVFRARDRYVARSKFTTWLYKIALNVISNARRTISRRHEVGVDCVEELPPDAIIDARGSQVLDSPAQHAMRIETQHLVRGTIATLNDRQRTALALFYWQGMSYVAIAESMDTSPKAVKSLLHRARSDLRTSLLAQPERLAGQA